jgi:gliding motility-associated-like protein
MHNLSWRVYILGLILISSSVNSIHAQRHSRCGSNPVVLSNFCADACLVCDLNGVSARTTHTIVGQTPPGYCTMFSHSMQWLAFIAGSTNLSFNVSVSNCNQPNGVEMGVYESDDCQTFRLVSNCNTNMFANQTWSFSTTGTLKIGCIYYLVFDGNGPNSCDLLFTVTSGSAAAPIPNTTAKIVGKAIVCKGETVNYSIAPITGACSYEWRIENGSINSTKDNTANVTWDQPGLGKICVRGVNECHTGNEVCLDVEIGDDSPPAEHGPFYVCFGETYRFNNFNLTAGTWEYFYKNRYGCDSTTIVIVEEFENIESRIDTSLCYPDTLKIGNKVYDSTGIYKSVFKSKLSPFCDSTVFINLNYSKLISVPNKTNDLNCNDTLSTLYADSSSIPKLGKSRYLWTNKNGDTLGQTKNIVVSQAGEYFLTVIHESDSIHNCIKSQSITVNGNRNIPDLLLLDSLHYCSGDTIHFNSIRFQDINNSNAGISIHSNIPCNALNKIDSSYIVLQSDSLIYLKASNGNCEDVIPLPFRIAPKDRALFQPAEICFDEEIDLGKLPYTIEGNFSGSPAFYYCPSRDTNCLIKVQTLKLQRDTIIYAYPESATCPDFSNFTIKVNPKPSSAFALNKTEYCKDDTLTLSKQMHDSLTNLFIKFDNIELQMINTSFIHKYLQQDTGVHVVCLRSERLTCTDTFCDVFRVHAPPIVPLINCFSTDSSILFTWSQHSGENYQVDVIQGGSYTQLSDTSVLFEKLNRGETIKIKVRAVNPYCNDVSAEIECQSKTCSPVQLNITPIDTICLDNSSSSLFLSAITNPNQSNGIWKWLGPGITDSLNGIFNPGIAGPGNHKIFSVLDQNGCRYFANTTIVVRDNPFSEFSIDSVVCQDSTIHLSFKGNKADSATFSWNLDGGIYKFLNGNRDLEISWHQPGIKLLKLKLNHYKCFHESFREIEVLEPLIKPVIDCETTDSTITFRWNKIKRVAKYKITTLNGNTGKLLNDTTYLIQKRFFNDSSTIQLTLEDEGPCSDVESNTIICKSPDCPSRNIVSDTILNYCDSDPQIIQLNQFIKDPITQFNWKGDFLQTEIINTSNLKSGTHIYLLTGKEFGCIYQDTLIININPSPQITSLEIQKINCDPLDKTGSVTIKNVSAQNPPISYSIDGKLFQSNPDFQNLTAGTYLLFVKDRFGCITDTIVEFIEPEIPGVELGPDVEILKGDRFSLSAMIVGSYNFIDWITSQTLSCQNCVNPIIQPEQTIKLYCLITNADGCTALDSITIRVIDNKIFAPNSFSPNGDNINDQFTFFGNASMIRLLEIYNRWGEKIFSKQNFSPNESQSGWNGRWNDEPCLPGVYVYYGIVSFENGKDQVLKGDVTLIR